MDNKDRGPIGPIELNKEVDRYTSEKGIGTTWGWGSVDDSPARMRFYVCPVKPEMWERVLLVEIQKILADHNIPVVRQFKGTKDLEMGLEVEISP